MLENKLTVANLIYKDSCVGYRLFCVSRELENSLDVYDVSKEIGDTYDLGLLSDRDILLIPDGKLLISRDEIDNAYIVKDISDDSSILDTLLNIDYTNDNIIENMDSEDEDDSEEEVTEDSNDVDGSDNNFIDEIDDMYEDDEEDTDDVCDSNCDDTEDDNFVDTIDDMYYDEDEEESEDDIIKNGIVDYLCGLYLKPSRLCKFKEARGIPVNLGVEIGNELRKVESDLSIEDVSNGVINRMQKEGYVYKSVEEFCNGMTEGTFIEI